MSLFNEYQTLTHLECPSQQDLERMAEIVEILSSDEGFSAIMQLEYLLAQNEGLLSEENLQQYLENRTKLINWIEVDIAMMSTHFPHSHYAPTAKQ